MTNGNITENVVALLMETGKNHHVAFKESGGVDPEWPLWYADHLHEPLGNILNTKLTKSEIIYLLMKLEKQRMANDPEAEWPKYYAKILVDQYI